MGTAGRASARHGFAGVAGTSVIAVALLTVGGAAAQGQGNCLGSPATITGTTGNDVIFGTPGDDVIDAQGGDDVVFAGDGNDKVCLGDGMDIGVGGNGDDEVVGGTGDDMAIGDHLSSTEIGRGDDEVVGGDGEDVVIGDSSNEAGNAMGEGDDKVNGGAGDDVVIGDAYSSDVAAGTGEDDVDAGPGSDVAVGDVLVGDPTGQAPGAGARQGEGHPVGIGSGGDAINTQTGEDLLVGDALSFEATATSRRGLGFAVLAELLCGKRLARQVLSRFFQGFSQQEIADFVEDKLRAEFDSDLVVGDCANIRRLRTDAQIAMARLFPGVNGGGPDDLLSGNEGPGFKSDNPGGSTKSGDIGIGGNLGWGKTASADKDKVSGQAGNDTLFGDGPQFLDSNDKGQFLVDSSGFQIFSAPRMPPFPPTADTNGDGVVNASDYTVWRNSFSTDAMAHTFNRAQRATGRGGSDVPPLEGGGKDQVGGGDDNDFLEGGAKKDLCKGGDGRDKAVEKGPLRCEKVKGVP